MYKTYIFINTEHCNNHVLHCTKMYTLQIGKRSLGFTISTFWFCALRLERNRLSRQDTDDGEVSGIHKMPRGEKTTCRCVRHQCPIHFFLRV